MQIMNVRQLADYLGYTVRTVYNLRYEGRLPYHRLNGVGRPYFIKDEIDNILGCEEKAERILNGNALK